MAKRQVGKTRTVIEYRMRDRKRDRPFVSRALCSRNSEAACVAATDTTNQHAGYIHISPSKEQSSHLDPCLLHGACHCGCNCAVVPFTATSGIKTQIQPDITQTSRNQIMTATDAERRQALPASPFFRPSVAIRVTERGIHTPRGQHRRKHNLVKPKVEEHKSGLLGCAANMGVAIVGSGIVGLPYAIKQAGFVAGVCLIVLTAVLTEKSLRLLVETAKHLHKQSYETAAEVPFGVAGFRFVLINMFIMSYGAMVTYLMITKDCASLLLSVTDKNTQQLVLLAVSLTIQLPLACLRDMADLEKTSALAVLIDVVIVALVAYSSPWIEGVREHGGWLELVKNDTVHYSSIFVGLGVLSFAFECQESAFLVAGSLDRPTAKRWGTVTSFTLAFCALLALVCGITGYFGYFDHAKGNILNNLDPSLSTTVAAQAMLGVTMLARIPWRRSWPVTCASSCSLKAIRLTEETYRRF